MEYLNFELRIGAKNNGQYPVTVIRSPAGETSAMVSFPVDDQQFKSRLDGISTSRRAGHTRKTSNTSDDSTEEPDTSRKMAFSLSGGEMNTIKTLGSDLFVKLFPAEIRSCFRSSLQKAREEKKGLRIRLRVEAPDLAGLPWEYLYDETEGDHLCLSSETPLIRFLELARPQESLTLTPPLNILVMVASPKDLPSLNIEREKTQMITAVEHMIDKGFITLTWLEGQSIGNVFNEAGRSMLILGEPGAGKTTMLLTLARELLDQYESTPGMPLPVVFNLSSWTHSGKNLSEWLADELSMKYMIPRKIGEEWVGNHHLLLLLDGLDEVGTDRRNACVNAINAFMHETAIMGIVVCCRFKEYIELDAKLIMNGAIRLRLLSKEKIMSYVTAAGASFTGLHDLLLKDSSFLKLAETPFMLSMMMRTYQHLDIGAKELAIGAWQSMQAKRKQLMDAYIKRQFRLVER